MPWVKFQVEPFHPMHVWNKCIYMRPDIQYECMLYVVHLEILYVNFSMRHLFNRCLKPTTSSSILYLLRISLVPFTHISLIFLRWCFLFSGAVWHVCLPDAFYSDLCPPYHLFLLACRKEPFRSIFRLIRQSVKSMKKSNFQPPPYVLLVSCSHMLLLTRQKQWFRVSNMRQNLIECCSQPCAQIPS